MDNAKPFGLYGAKQYDREFGTIDGKFGQCGKY